MKFLLSVKTSCIAMQEVYISVDPFLFLWGAVLSFLLFTEEGHASANNGDHNAEE